VFGWLYVRACLRMVGGLVCVCIYLEGYVCVCVRACVCVFG